jgi:hypothetical protein
LTIVERRPPEVGVNAVHPRPAQPRTATGGGLP